MTPADQQRIVEQLIAQGLLSQEQLPQLQQAAQKKGIDIVEYIIQSRVVHEEDVVKLKAAVANMPYIYLVDEEISSDVLDIIGHEIADNYQVVPFSRDGQTVNIAVRDPHNVTAMEALDFIARRDNIHFVYHVASEASIHHALRQHENLGEEVAEALQLQSEDVLAEDAFNQQVQDDVQSAPVAKMVSVILRYAVEGKASDVHIEPTEEDTRVRYRVDGVLQTSLQVPKNIHNAVVARIKVMSNLKLDETRIPQDGRFRAVIDKREIDFRVSTMPLVGQEKVVMRILDKDAGLRGLENLGYIDHNFNLLTEQMRRPHGMILITGPTGSGKSTTLYAVLNALNEDTRNILTLEDPVEYNMPGVSQTQVRPEIGFTFALGLRAVLRQDPDIVMVGEIRDHETAELAVHAALTGHMLLSTLHTNSAWGTIPRLLDMGMEPFLLASSLNLVVAQRLLRRLCEECKRPATLTPEMHEKVEAELRAIPPQSLPSDVVVENFQTYEGEGCTHCDGTGYKGRLSVTEMVEMTNAIEDIISADQIGDSDIVQKALHEQGMVTLKQDGLIKALRGETTVEEVWTATTDR